MQMAEPVGAQPRTVVDVAPQQWNAGTTTFGPANVPGGFNTATLTLSGAAPIPAGGAATDEVFLQYAGTGMIGPVAMASLGVGSIPQGFQQQVPLEGAQQYQVNVTVSGNPTFGVKLVLS